MLVAVFHFFGWIAWALHLFTVFIWECVFFYLLESQFTNAKTLDIPPKHLTSHDRVLSSSFTLIMSLLCKLMCSSQSNTVGGGTTKWVCKPTTKKRRKRRRSCHFCTVQSSLERLCAGVCMWTNLHASWCRSRAVPPSDTVSVCTWPPDDHLLEQNFLNIYGKKSHFKNK